MKNDKNHPWDDIPLIKVLSGLFICGVIFGVLMIPFL